MKFMWESFDDVLQAELQGDNRFTSFAGLSDGGGGEGGGGGVGVMLRERDSQDREALAGG